jgi:hypothetical protein
VSSTITAVRSAAGRAGTLLGAAALAGSMMSTPVALTTAAATAGLATAGLAISVQPGRRQLGADVTVLYLVSPALLAAEAVTFRVIPGIPWWGEALAGAGWFGATWFFRPSFGAGHIARATEALHTANAAEAALTPEERLVRWWDETVGCEDGPAPGTRLTDPQVDDPTTFRAVIVALAGQPVPDIAPVRLSALTDIPADRIRIEPVPDRGSRYKKLLVGTDKGADPNDLPAYWAAEIAPLVMPGSRIVDIRRGALVRDTTDQQPPPAVTLPEPTAETLAAVTAALIKTEDPQP